MKLCSLAFASFFGHNNFNDCQIHPQSVASPKTQSDSMSICVSLEKGVLHHAINGTASPSVPVLHVLQRYTCNHATDQALQF
jgi:hypothetical protein